MRCGTAVGINNDFTTGQAAVALRTADDEASGRVDQIFDVAFDQIGWNDGADDFLNHTFAHGFQAHIGVVLGG